MKQAILIGLLGAFLVSGLTGCETSFQGDAKVADGPRGCDAKCRSWGLEFAGMVAMGEYSDGCICRVMPRPGQAQNDRADDTKFFATSAMAASVGVITAMRERERNQHSFAVH
ncbi:MAG TPA: hypothetical protein VHV51_14605 [Polyangiaceae bacterium]|nr:hypothetical protein [Polyangiaceae bacterium]